MMDDDCEAPSLESKGNKAAKICRTDHELMKWLLLGQACGRQAFERLQRAYEHKERSLSPEERLARIGTLLECLEGLTAAARRQRKDLHEECSIMEDEEAPGDAAQGLTPRTYGSGEPSFGHAFLERAKLYPGPRVLLGVLDSSASNASQTGEANRLKGGDKVAFRKPVRQARLGRRHRQ